MYLTLTLEIDSRNPLLIYRQLDLRGLDGALFDNGYWNRHWINDYAPVIRQTELLKEDRVSCFGVTYQFGIRNDFKIDSRVGCIPEQAVTIGRWLTMTTQPPSKAIS